MAVLAKMAIYTACTYIISILLILPSQSQTRYWDFVDGPPISWSSLAVCQLVITRAYVSVRAVIVGFVVFLFTLLDVRSVTLTPERLLTKCPCSPTRGRSIF